MANVPCFILFGQSNAQGVDVLANVSADDYGRWTGQSSAFPDINPITESDPPFPIDIEVPGVYHWQTRMPYDSTVTVFDNATNALTYTAADVTIAGVSFSANELDDHWVYVAENATSLAQGQLARISSHGTSDPAVLTIEHAATPNWTATPSDGGVLKLINNAHTVAGGSTASSLVSAHASAPFTASALVGKWVTILYSTNVLLVGQSRKITANTTTTLTLDSALTATPGTDDCFVVYDSGVSDFTDLQTLGVNSSQVGKFGKLRLFYDAALLGSSAVSPHTTGFEYANHNQAVLSSPSYYSTLGTGPVIEIGWGLRQYHSQPVFIINLAFGSTYISQFLTETSNARFSWYDDSKTNDFHPGSYDTQAAVAEPDLFEILVTMIRRAANWLDTNSNGDRLDIRGIFSVIGESDAIDEYRSSLAEQNMRLIRDTLRQKIEDEPTSNAGPWSTLPGSQIPFIIAGVRTTDGVWTHANTVNTAFQRLANDDLYTGYVSTDDISVIADNIHYDASSTGIVRLGKNLVAEWLAVQRAAEDATTQRSRRLNLATLRQNVRRRYERNHSGADLENSNLDQALNDARREFANTIGENAWWRRRIEPIAVSSGFQTTTTLPYHVRRIIRLEEQHCPGRMVDWKLMGYTDEGRLQISVSSVSSSTLNVHHMIDVDELTEDAQIDVIPRDYKEIIEVLTCKRLAESLGNVQLATYWAAESERLYRYVKRDNMRYMRGRDDALFASRERWSQTGVGFDGHPDGGYY